MNRTLKTLLLGGLVTAAALPVAAIAGGHRGGGPGMHHMERMAEELDLTEAQKAQIKEIVAENRAEAATVRGQVRATMIELDQAIESGADNDTIATLAKEAHTLRTQARELRGETREEISTVLTDAQKAQLEELRAERREAHGDREAGGHRRGGPDGKPGGWDL